MDITTLLVSLKTVTELAKLIRESDVSLEKAEIKLKLADLITALADAKIEVADIQQTLLDKDEEIRGLREQLRIKENVVWQKPFYWLKDGESKDGPFCQHCYDYDKHQELIRLYGRKGQWQCKACRNGYTDHTYKSSEDDSSDGNSVSQGPSYGFSRRDL
jgi:hypothetical protein